MSVFPVLRYRDAHAAIDFLERAFGFERHAIHAGDDGKVAHAEVRAGDGFVMLGSSPPEATGPVYVAIPDVDAVHERAKAAGAEIVTEPFDTDYGSRDFTARDPGGVTWHFGTYRPE